MDYEIRYLGGIILFNEGDYFEAHEVWESLWLDYAGPDRSFYQGLIQAAVGLLHFANGNLRGAKKLYTTSKMYMEQYGVKHLGLDLTLFWNQMTTCFADIISDTETKPGTILNDDWLPSITLDPEPKHWPTREEYWVEEDEP